MIKYLKLFNLKNYFFCFKFLKLNNFIILKINILQFQKLLNILGVQIIAKKWKNFEIFLIFQFEK